MTKKKLRRRIAQLERELALQAPPTFQSVTVLLGATGGGVGAIEFPVLSTGRVKPLDLPALGYKVMWLGEPVTH